MYKKQLIVAWVPVALWAIFIFILSSVPGKNIPEFQIPNFHKLVHLIEYAVLGFLLIRAFMKSVFDRSFIILALVSIIIIIFFALSDEWHQSFIPGRNCDLSTVLFDIISSAIGIFLYKKIYIKSRY